MITILINQLKVEINNRPFNPALIDLRAYNPIQNRNSCVQFTNGAGLH